MVETEYHSKTFELYYISPNEFTLLILYRRWIPHRFYEQIPSSYFYRTEKEMITKLLSEVDELDSEIIQIYEEKEIWML